jgi:formate C-acetyltransferase
MILKNDDVLMKMLKLPPNEVLNLLLKNEMRLSGNLATMSRFNFLLSLLLESPHKEKLENREKEDRRQALADKSPSDPEGAKKLAERRKARLKGRRSDAVEFLDDPHLSQYSLEDFPRLKKFLDIHLTAKPEVCHERAKLLTDWFRVNGFETDRNGNPWAPELRQAHAYKFMMENRDPLIRGDDLIAGTTTTKEIGVVLYPDTSGTLLWSELRSVPYRQLNPYAISEKTANILNQDVFPFWEKRNVREWVRREYGEPLCQQIDERFAAYFLWKSVALSHTIADFPKLLRLGVSGVIEEIRAELAKSADVEKDNLLRAMILTLEGVNAYAESLQKRASEGAESERDPRRAAELRRLAEILERAPKYPPRRLDEALNAIWILWVALHMENTNAGLSLGRMDQWLQPFFAEEIAGIAGAAEREAYVRRAVELVGCFYMRCTDHLPMVPDIGNFLFGGSSSDQAITLGGQTPDGKSAVNDMTHIFLKVTEMLGIRDPNVNARYTPGVNSDEYLKRLCEVNLITAATPSMHNDDAVIASLAEFGYPAEHVRNWSATGCVEPTISGRHIGHTNCMMMNMVAALEMALNNGRHPVMDWELGPKTGGRRDDDFPTFESFFGAFEEQYKFLIDNSCEYNNLLGRGHGVVRPTPLLSSLIEGCIASGRDVTKGGALYNTSGAACIGLADVTDSMMAVKKLVYDEKRVTFQELSRAAASNFKNDRALHAHILNRAPKFGSGDPEALEMATRIARFSHDCYGSHVNFRGGKYTAGFWSMSNHVAFGVLTGALPSGRLAGKPFTPGLTPAPAASDNLLDPIRDVASLKPEYMNNNIAFNVKIVPGADDSHERIVENIFSYVKTYFDLGGMQMQLNVVTSAILRDAMKHPENYRNLLVRISGYNAYFVTLNRDMQIELIERAEYKV